MCETLIISSRFIDNVSPFELRQTWIHPILVECEVQILLHRLVMNCETGPTISVGQNNKTFLSTA